jgi:hypothetical protein
MEYIARMSVANLFRKKLIIVDPKLPASGYQLPVATS